MVPPHHVLLTACAEGDADKVREGILVLRQSGVTETPLKDMARKAVENNHADVLEICIDEGIELSDLCGLEHETDSEQVLKILVAKGGLNVNQDWETAGDMLINAVWELKVGPRSISGEAQFESGYPLHEDLANAFAEQYDFVKWLLEHGADPNSGHLMQDSTSAITAAAERGRLDLAELLVGYGARVSGSGALAGAAGEKQLAVVQWLLDRGAEINEKGVHDHGDRRHEAEEGTALHKAAANGDLEMVKLLIDRGAGLEVKDPLGRTALMRALEKNQEDAAAYLKSSR